MKVRVWVVRVWMMSVQLYRRRCRWQPSNSWKAVNFFAGESWEKTASGEEEEEEV